MRTGLFKRSVCMLLVMVILIGMLPINVFAMEDASETLVTEDTELTEVIDATEPTEETEATEDTEATEATEVTEATVFAASTEVTEVVEETAVSDTEEEHSHEYTSEVTDPTCNEQGYTTYTCECGDSYVDDYVDATGHTYENGICAGCGENEPSESMSLRYDDHLDMSGKTVEIIDAGTSTSDQVDATMPDTAIVTLDGDTLIATGIGTAKVKIDDQLYDVTVEKAKVNLIVIMGQSNAGNHFENATSDVTCPIGTAYWWGNGKGTAATEPVPYTQPSMGFHTPLLAELYAQSVAAGDPVKNVLIWQEGITSKNGQSIVKWAASATDTSGTDATVTMIQNCRNYYEKHSDLYEIVNSGVYWLQGESDTAMDPALYTQLFMAIWERLENAGMEYLAFLRLRWGVNGNGLDHQDLHHSASLSAQIQMINENPNFYMATDLTENWVGTETATHTVDISKYITVMEAYGNSPTYTDVYGNHATYADGKLTTTMKSLYGSNNKCHYGKFGYGLIGADAAYNMYNALKTNDSAIVVTDTSGHANRKKLLTNGQQMTIDITNMSDDLSFRPACGSTAGTLEIVIRSSKDDITNHDGLLIADGLRYGSICVSELRNYNNASIEITYNTANGKKHTAVCNVTTQLAGPKKDYIWNFNEDLYARDEEGNILNSFLIEPLAGSYTLENGYLTGKALMLQLEQLIELEADKNWFVEWKYGTFVNGSAGFLLCEEATNSIGNKAFYHASTGRMMISDYADKKGYRNYTSSDVVIDEYDCLRITNRYDPTTGKSILSLWKNGELVIENFQMKGSLNSDTDNMDMTGYPLEGNFAFGYLGHDKNPLWGMNCELDYLHISFGAEHPNLANYEGKVISILGDSISTFAGYIPVADGFNLEHLPRYPDADRIPDVTVAEQTWWMQVITELDAKLGINDSWRGAMVSGAAAVTTGSTGPNASMANLQRIRNLGANGTPDVILFYGGTNDYAHLSAIGTFDPATAPVEADLTAKSWNNLADAYVQTLLRLRHFYPDAMIVSMLPTYTASYYSDAKLAQGNAVLTDICSHYDIPCLDLRDSGVTAAHLPDGIHPGAEGMDLITDAVVDLLLSQCNLESGENVVYSVTHDLSGASASLGYMKGVTHGTAFSESITGDNLNVTITMGGTDITNLCYADGKVTVSSVTGDLVITAKGRFNADGHLQMLPDQVCCGTNLWSVLEHDKQYYTANGWGIHSSGRVCSVTFPVCENDRIYATSFGAGSVNGSGGTNGIRVTYFFEDGSVRSLSADTVYKEFAANGHLTIPADVLAVSIPMWKVSDSNELYIRNREHSFENWKLEQQPTQEQPGKKYRKCSICGFVETDALEYAANRLYLEAVVLDGQTSAWIDGKEYAVNTDSDMPYVDLPDGKASTLITYTYGESNGKPYPIGMKVWLLSNADDSYTATRVEEFDDMLTYEGCAIRITGKQGIRMITSIDEKDKAALTGNGLAGYTLKEYGTAIAWADQLSSRKPLVLGKSHVRYNYAYSKEKGKDPIYDNRDGKMFYTNVLVGFGLNQCNDDIAMRPYMILEDAKGSEITLYGGIVERSIGYIASEIQKKNLYAPDSAEYEYLQKIIDASTKA